MKEKDEDEDGVRERSEPWWKLTRPALQAYASSGFAEVSFNGRFLTTSGPTLAPFSHALSLPLRSVFACYLGLVISPLFTSLSFKHTQHQAHVLEPEDEPRRPRRTRGPRHAHAHGS